jgi:hypothetical protein
MRTKYKKYQSGGLLPAKSGRLSKQERRRLRELRKNQKAQGFKRKSATGLTSAEAVEKQRLERRRKENVGQDIKKGAIAAGALGAAALAAPAVIGALGGGAGAAGAGAAGAGAAGTGAAATGVGATTAAGAGGGLLGKGVSLIEKASKAADVVNQAKNIADTAGKFVPKSLQQTEQPESFMNTMDAIANDPNFTKFGSTEVSQYAQPAGGDNVPAMDLDRTSVNKLLGVLSDGSSQEAPEGAPEPLESIMAGRIGLQDRLTSSNPRIQEIQNSFMDQVGGFKPERGLAGLGEVFATGGRVTAGDPKKKEAMKLIALNEGDYDNNLGDFFRAGEMEKADSVRQVMMDRYKRIVDLGYEDEALDSLPYDKLSTFEGYKNLVKQQAGKYPK